MRTGVALCLLLFLMSFISEAQGIRPSLRGVDHPELLPNNAGLLKQTGYGGEEVEIKSCKNGDCSGNGRKLVTAVKPTDTTASHYSKTEKNIGKKPYAAPASKHNNENDGKHAKSITDSQVTEQSDGNNDRYSEAIEITEMDYSPARRKPPIHN